MLPNLAKNVTKFGQIVARFGQKCCQIWPKMLPSLTKNVAKFGQKCCQVCPKNVAKLGQKCCKIRPKMLPNSDNLKFGETKVSPSVSLF